MHDFIERYVLAGYFWCKKKYKKELKDVKYLLQLKQQWGEKYAEWMAETERKLAELQEANTLLQVTVLLLQHN